MAPIAECRSNGSLDPGHRSHDPCKALYCVELRTKVRRPEASSGGAGPMNYGNSPGHCQLSFVAFVGTISVQALEFPLGLFPTRSLRSKLLGLRAANRPSVNSTPPTLAASGHRLLA